MHFREGMNSAVAKEMQEWQEKSQERGKWETKGIEEIRKDQTQIEHAAHNDATGMFL